MRIAERIAAQHLRVVLEQHQRSGFPPGALQGHRVLPSLRGGIVREAQERLDTPKSGGRMRVRNPTKERLRPQEPARDRGSLRLYVLNDDQIFLRVLP